ncbi:transcription factor ILR3-like [Carex rostrata]
MEQNAMDEYWIDEGGLDGDLRCALEGFCGTGPIGVEFEEAYNEVCGVEQACSRKRTRDESGPGTKSKACREKMRRDKLNERFVELSTVLDPTRPPKSDKATLLSDAARIVVQLRNEAQEMKESNEKLEEAIKDLKVEKNELRDEKMRLKADKEMLEQQVKVLTTAPPTGFMPHPMAFHPTIAHSAPPFTPINGHSPGIKPATHFGPYPQMAMWHWLPPGITDTTQDAKLFPPTA